jgi:hypothetical protein
VEGFASSSIWHLSAISTSTTKGAPPAVVRSGSVRIVGERSDCSGITDISFLLSGTCEVSRSVIRGSAFVFNATSEEWTADGRANGLESTSCGAELEDFGEWITLGCMDIPWFTSLPLSMGAVNEKPFAGI